VGSLCHQSGCFFYIELLGLAWPQQKLVLHLWCLFLKVLLLSFIIWFEFGYNIFIYYGILFVRILCGWVVGECVSPGGGLYFALLEVFARGFLWSIVGSVGFYGPLFCSCGFQVFGREICHMILGFKNYYWIGAFIM